MKDIILFILILLVFWIGSENLKLRSEIKPFKEVLPQNEYIHRLECGTFKRDSIVAISGVFFRNEKEFNNFYQFYNTNK